MKGLIRAFRVLLHVPIENLFFVLFFWLLNGFIDVTASEMTGNRLRERGGTRSKGPQTRTQTWGAVARTKPLYKGSPLYQLS